jgi:hypothetical protein
MELFAYGSAVRRGAENTSGLFCIDDLFEPRASSGDAEAQQQQTLETAKCMVRESYKDLVCPITQDLLHAAVMTTDGQLYSEAALRTWWQGKRIFKSPGTGLDLESNDMRPAFAVREHIKQLLDDVVKSGKAGALAGSANPTIIPQALQIQKTVASRSPAEIHNPSDDFVEALHDMCADVHLRDFAAKCGALNMAAACFTSRQNSATVLFLVRMLSFSAGHQEDLAFLIPLAVTGLSSLDLRRQCHSFEVLSALVCDRDSIPTGLVDELHQILSPIITMKVVRVEVSALLFKSAMLFLLHLLTGKQESMSPVARRLRVVGVPAVTLHVLQTMKHDIEAISLACWLVRVLADIDDDLKTTLRDTPGLQREIEDALCLTKCAYFALYALAALSDERGRCLGVLDSITDTREWILNPRKVAMNAVQALHDHPTPVHVSSLCLSILADATDRTGEVLRAGVPTTANVTTYILRYGVPHVVDMIRLLCTQGSWEIAQHGLCLLGNIACAVDGHSKALIGSASDAISHCIIDTLEAAGEGFKKAACRHQCLCILHSGLTVLRQYFEIMTDRDAEALQLGQNIVGLCRDSIDDLLATMPEGLALRLCHSLDAGCLEVDFICNAFSMIGVVCDRVDYDKIFVHDTTEHLVDSLEKFADNNQINFEIAQVLQTLICSSHFEPASSSRVYSRKNGSYADEIIDSHSYTGLCALLERPSLDFKTMRLPVLTVLRDVAPRIPDDEEHKNHVENWMASLMQTIRDCLDVDTADAALTVKIGVETIANLLRGDTPGPFAGVGELRGAVSELGWRAAIRELNVAPLMFRVLESFSASAPAQADVLEQGLRVIVLLLGVDGSSLRARDLKIVAQVMNTVGSLPCAQRAKTWHGFEDRVCSDNAHCLEVACALLLVMLNHVADHELKAQVKVLIDSQMVEAVITVLSRASLRARDPGNSDLYITQLGEETAVHLLRRLLPFASCGMVMRIADEFAAVILKNNTVFPAPPIDLIISDDEGKTRLKRSHASVVTSAGGAAGGAAAKKKKH